MAMKMKVTNYREPTKQILAMPDHYVALGFKHLRATADSTGLSVLEDGRRIVKAGTIYPANTSAAIGVVLNDYDVTDGDAMMAVVIHGFIEVAKLPKVPSSDAISALKQITFVPIAPINFTFVVGTAKAKNTEVVDDIVGVASLTLTGAKFRAEAATIADIATNWTVADSADAAITEITLSDDMKTATFKIGLAATKTAFKTGSLTVIPGAHVVSTGKTLTTPAKIFDVTVS